jgi:2-methylcitrate dehydratase
METIAERLSSYAVSLHYGDLPEEVRHQAKRHIIDTLGCALGAYSSEPSKIARDLAATVISSQPATIIGSGQTTSPDLATFANGVMIRYLDFNDGYTSKESGHPSDSIAAVLSSAEMARAGGQRVITATVLAYETFCRFGDASNIRYKGIDHVTMGCIASILGATRSLCLSKEKTFHALNLGIAPNIALIQTRLGTLSMWKGCAHANASRNAVFATMLASKGLTGPSPIFEGDGGYFKIVTRETCELEPFGGQGRPFKIMECLLKAFPLGQYSQTIVQAALEVRKQLPDIRDIAQVNIKTMQKAVDIMADTPDKWHPITRETADHSMPYNAAVALMYGTVNLHHFDNEYLQNPQLLDLISRVRVGVSEEANRRVPEAMLCNLEVVTKSGQHYSSEVAYHKGHSKNPLSDSEVEDKFHSLTCDLLPPARARALLDRLWNLEEVTDISEVIRMTKI